MNRDIYFCILFKEITDGPSRGVVVHIPQDHQHLPGERIRGLTEAARTFSREREIKLRTEMLVAPPAGLDLRPLDDYLWGDGTLNATRLIRHLADYCEGRKPHRFLPKVGMTVVMEEEFIGREQVLETLEEHMACFRSCHLRAPRRYGKSSLLGRLATKNERAVMLELSDIGTLKGFLKTLLRSCMRHSFVRQRLHDVPAYRSWAQETDHANFSRVFNREFNELMERTGETKLLDLIRDTMTALADQRIILLVDEFSLFVRDMHVQSPDVLAVFLEMFSTLRTRAQNPLVTVFAGSAGLSTYMELYGMREKFADLKAIDVPPVTTDEARLLAEELLYGMDKLPTMSAIDRLVEFTGNHDSVPYFVQALTSYAAEQTGMRRVISSDDIEQAYYDRLLGPQGNVCFRDFILRERAYPDEYRASASAILKHLSQQAPSTAQDTELQQLCKQGCEYEKLMTCLEEDYDLVHGENGWRMRSRVIADRWRLGEPWLTVGGN